jgi:membrane-associated phospholipid phosphatase
MIADFEVRRNTHSSSYERAAFHTLGGTTMSFSISRLTAGLAAILLAGGCTDVPTPTDPAVSQSAIRFWETGSTVAWNETAQELLTARVPNPVAQVRILAYLSVAQYNAIITAESEIGPASKPSPAGAAAGASLVVLKNFFPLDHALIESRLAAQRVAAPAPLAQQKDFLAGEDIGRTVGAAVLAYAATDNFNATVPPANPGGQGNWTGINSVRGLYGTRTFALISGDQFRPPPPPSYLSPEYNTALAEVRSISDGLTGAQLTIAQFWAVAGSPGYLNGVATDMIVSHHRSEREAARILSLTNMAAFDVLNACFDAKFAYYFIRPSQADPLINIPVGLPNHPSYPSGHSCITGAMATVMANAFPEKSDFLEAIVEEAGIARMYGGLHYRFDCEAGRDLGRNVAEWVMSTTAGGNAIIPLD